MYDSNITNQGSNNSSTDRDKAVNYLTRLRQLITECCTKEDLRLLCQDLAIDYENFRNAGKETQVADLLDYLKKRSLVADLVNLLRNRFPNIDWEPSLKAAIENVAFPHVQHQEEHLDSEAQEPPNPSGELTNCSRVQLAVFQVFRVADLVSPPLGGSKEFDCYNHLLYWWVKEIFEGQDLITLKDQVKENPVLDSLAAWRRTINRKRPIQIGQLGEMKPIISSEEKYDDFWRGAHAATRANIAGINLAFIPFQLSLTDFLNHWKFDPISILDPGKEIDLSSLVNIQITGHLRIYPPGAGVVQLRITLTFRGHTPVKPITEIIENLHELIFVDPEGDESGENRLILQIIDQAVKGLYLPNDIERRWLPPATTLMILDNQTFNPIDNIDELTHLLSSIAGNNEWYNNYALLKKEITSHWKKEKILALAHGKGALLCIQTTGENKHKKRVAKQHAEWALDVYELVSATTYSLREFVERVSVIVYSDYLSSKWVKSNEGFLEFYILFYTLRELQRAIHSVDRHLTNQPVGFLRRLGKAVWHTNNMVDQDEYYQMLNTIENRLLSFAWSLEPLLDLIELIRSLQQIRKPFG